MARVRVAFVGKGGAGKSTIAGTFARLLARTTGEPVLAIDSDPMPGLPYALGVPVDDNPIPDEAVVEGPKGGPRWVLRPGLTPAEVVDRWAVEGPDGVRYLQFGNLWGHVSSLQRAQHAWSEVVRDLDPAASHLVGDLPGGTRQAMAGWARYADVVCVVVEPTIKSLHSGLRLLNLDAATWGPRHLLVVANKVTAGGGPNNKVTAGGGPNNKATADGDDVSRIEWRLGRPVAAAVPADVGVAVADRRAASPLDAVPDGPFVAAVAGLVAEISNLYPLDEAPPRLGRRVIS